MKKLLYAIVLLTLSGLFTACQKDINLNLVDGKTPDQRTREYMNNVRDVLSSSPHGWVGYLTIPNNGLSFSYYLQFTKEGRVQMYSDFNGESMITPRESSYALRNTSIPSLIFDSFNYMHMPADPSEVVSGGERALGLYADFEFGIHHVSTDTVILEGYLRKNSLTLVRLKAEERTSVDDGGLGTMVDRLQSYFQNNDNNYITMIVGGQEHKIGVSYGHTTRQLSYSVFESDGGVSSASATFNYSVSGMEILNNNLKYGDEIFKALRFKGDDKLYVIDHTGKEYEIKQNDVPLIPLSAMFGFGKTYTVLRISGENLPTGVSSDFNSIFNGLVTRFNGTGRTISFTEVIFASNNRGFVLLRYAAASSFSAIARFDYSINTDNEITITNWDSSTAVANSNWTSRTTEVGNFATWFENEGPFKLDWVPGVNAVLGGLIPVNNPSNFFYGILRETPELSVAQYL